MFKKIIIAALAFASAANGVKINNSFTRFITCTDDSDCPDGQFC